MGGACSARRPVALTSTIQGHSVTVVVLTLSANVPTEEALRIGYDPDVAVAALFALVTVPYFARFSDRLEF
jgi:hypothetical protein